VKLAVLANLLSLLTGIALLISPLTLHAQTTKISTEYLMTVYAPLEPVRAVDSSLYIYNVKPGGWAKGPKINGVLVPPGGDWLRVMPSGVSRLDVRVTIKTDDGALIYMSYNGIIKDTKESEARADKGEVMTSKDHYFVIAPTLETSAEKYDWLNGVQCIGKIVEDKTDKNDSYVRYDIFVVR
jgi:Protein of unknown function (DUF3237)